MGQMLKEFREKRENIIPLKVGKNNKMATGGSPSTQRLMIYLHPLIPPYSPFFLCKLSVRKPYFKWYPSCSLKWLYIHLRFCLFSLLLCVLFSLWNTLEPNTIPAVLCNPRMNLHLEYSPSWGLWHVLSPVSWILSSTMLQPQRLKARVWPWSAYVPAWGLGRGTIFTMMEAAMNRLYRLFWQQL